MEIKTYGLCLSSYIYNEKDKLCNIATIDQGKICAKLVSYAKSKIRLCGETFCFAEYILNNRNNKYTIINCSIADSFVNCWQNIEKNLCATAVVEILDKIGYKELIIKDELLLAVDTLKLINYKETFPILFLIRFLLILFRSLGVDMKNSNTPSNLCDKFLPLETLDAEYFETMDIYKHEATLFLKYLYFELVNFSEIKIITLEKLLTNNLIQN